MGVTSPEQVEVGHRRHSAHRLPSSPAYSHRLPKAWLEGGAGEEACEDPHNPLCER